MIEVDEKFFRLFMRWYDDNISIVRSEIVTVADRINYFNRDNDLIGFINVYMETTYHIREVYYNLMLIK